VCTLLLPQQKEGKLQSNIEKTREKDWQITKTTCQHTDVCTTTAKRTGSAATSTSQNKAKGARKRKGKTERAGTAQRTRCRETKVFAIGS